MKMKKDGCNIDINPLNRAYGGIKTGGGYSCHTEYEIGAQRIAEALHCILGSIHAVHRYKDEPWHQKAMEEAHIMEELGLIKKLQGEYSRRLYIDRGWYGNTEESLKSIRDASRRLDRETDCRIRQLSSHKKNIDPGVFNISMRCYQLLNTIANKMEYSVRGQGERPMWNALYDRRIERGINGLERSIESFFR